MSNQENKPDIIHQMNNKIMKFKCMHDINTDATVHIGLNAFYLELRQEVHNLHRMQLRARKEKMRELFIQDFLQEDKELREVDFAYVNTQP